MHVMKDIQHPALNELLRYCYSDKLYTTNMFYKKKQTNYYINSSISFFLLVQGRFVHNLIQFIGLKRDFKCFPRANCFQVLNFPQFCQNSTSKQDGTRDLGKILTGFWILSRRLAEWRNKSRRNFSYNDPGILKSFLHYSKVAVLIIQNLNDNKGVVTRYV